MKPTKQFKPVSQPPPLDIEAEKDTFNNWKTQWGLYIKLSTIDEAYQSAAGREECKATQLLTCMSANILNIVVNARLDDAAMKDSTLIIKYLEDLSNAGKNNHVWRQQFNSCVQRQGLSIDNWLCELRDLARKCEFETGCCHLCEPERMLGQIIIGLTDKDVRIKLLEIVPSLTLGQTIVIVRTSEMSRLQAEQLQPGSVQGIRGKSAYKKAKSVRVTEVAARAAKPSPATGGATCDKCGYEIRFGGHNCPARNETCRGCNETGHFKNVCRKTAKGKVAAIHVSQVSSTEDDTVSIPITPQGVPPKEVRTLLDTGSTLDAIPSSTSHRQYRDVHLDTDIQAETAIGNHIKSLGSFKASVEWTANDGTSRKEERSYNDRKPPT